MTYRLDPRIAKDVMRRWALVPLPLAEDVQARCAELLAKWCEVYGARWDENEKRWDHTTGLVEMMTKHANIRGLADRGNIHVDEVFGGKLLRFVFCWKLPTQNALPMPHREVEATLALGEEPDVVCLELNVVVDFRDQIHPRLGRIDTGMTPEEFDARIGQVTEAWIPDGRFMDVVRVDRNDRDHATVYVREKASEG